MGKGGRKSAAGELRCLSASRCLLLSCILQLAGLPGSITRMCCTGKSAKAQLRLKIASASRSSRTHTQKLAAWSGILRSLPCWLLPAAATSFGWVPFGSAFCVARSQHCCAACTCPCACHVQTLRLACKQLQRSATCPADAMKACAVADVHAAAGAAQPAVPCSAEGAQPHDLLPSLGCGSRAASAAVGG